MSIKFENTEVVGWEAAIRGMRNPMLSHDKSDSGVVDCDEHSECDTCILKDEKVCLDKVNKMYIGPNDHDLMMRLRNAGTGDHRKFMRMITVYVDITAPLYWWKEFDTYKVGTVTNSCSTMHKIHVKEFTLDDFSTDHLQGDDLKILESVIDALNANRDSFINTKNKNAYWYPMIQLLPSSYNQKRTVMLNYEVLANIYKSRKHHKLDEWSVGFMDWIKSLLFSELITGEEK